MNKRNNQYTRIANKLIAELPEFEELRDSGVRIAFLESDEEKKKNRKIIFGDCAAVNKSRYDWCCPFDFLITVYKPNCELFGFDRDKYITLIRHELHHAGVDNDGDEPKYYVIPHDVEEFWDIINDKGLDWQVK
ncbi:MAG: putative metallopeptidase [Clostridia bacterium]|nr:putative metallopeptidase [Clostridia bacterium]